MWKSSARGFSKDTLSGLGFWRPTTLEARFSSLKWNQWVAGHCLPKRADLPRSHLEVYGPLPHCSEQGQQEAFSRSQNNLELCQIISKIVLKEHLDILLCSFLFSPLYVSVGHILATVFINDLLTLFLHWIANIEGERYVTFRTGCSLSLRGSSIPFRDKTVPPFNCLLNLQR